MRNLVLAVCALLSVFALSTGILLGAFLIMSLPVAASFPILALSWA